MSDESRNNLQTSQALKKQKGKKGFIDYIKIYSISLSNIITKCNYY